MSARLDAQLGFPGVSGGLHRIRLFWRPLLDARTASRALGTGQSDILRDLGRKHRNRLGLPGSRHSHGRMGYTAGKKALGERWAKRCPQGRRVRGQPKSEQQEPGARTELRRPNEAKKAEFDRKISEIYAGPIPARADQLEQETYSAMSGRKGGLPSGQLAVHSRRTGVMSDKTLSVIRKSAL